jgi:hypothetical protein
MAIKPDLNTSIELQPYMLERDMHFSEIFNKVIKDHLQPLGINKILACKVASLLRNGRYYPGGEINPWICYDFLTTTGLVINQNGNAKICDYKDIYQKIAEGKSQPEALSTARGLQIRGLYEELGGKEFTPKSLEEAQNIILKDACTNEFWTYLFSPSLLGLAIEYIKGSYCYEYLTRVNLDIPMIKANNPVFIPFIMSSSGRRHQAERLMNILAGYDVLNYPYALGANFQAY